MHVLDNPGILALILFFVFIFLNFPISLSLGFSGVIVLYFFQVSPLSVIPQIFTGAVGSFTLLAIPLFVLAGSIIARSGMGERLIKLAQVLTGRLPGGLAVAVIVAGALFGALSGSNIAAIAALGFLIPAMHKEGYPLGFSCAVVAAGCTFGVVIPPSINLILYGVISNNSIPDLFAAGIGPGLALVVTISVYIVIIAKIKKYPLSKTKLNPRNFNEAFVSAFWALLAPIIILGGIYGGIFTATEAAAVAVVYVFLVERLIYRKLLWNDYLKLVLEAGITTSVIMLILAMASIVSYIFMVEGTADHVRDWLVLASSGNPVVLLLLANAVLLVAGCFLDPVSAIYLLVPLMLPAIRAVGIDEIQFGAIMTTNLSLAHITPPVGLALYLASQIAGIPFIKAAKAALPFVFCEIFVLLMVTLFPSISLSFVWLFS